MGKKEKDSYVVWFNKKQHLHWEELTKEGKTIMTFNEFVKSAYSKEIVRMSGNDTVRVNDIAEKK